MSKRTSNFMTDKKKIAYMARKKNLPIGAYLGVMNPDLSIIVDSNAYFTDDKSRPDRNKTRVREGEIALQGWLYPGIRGDFYATFEQEYEADRTVNTSVDLEAATISFLDLPLDQTAKAGRMFVEFGEMNKIHQHHRSTVDQPLVLEHFFGNHSWIDDGVQVTALIPNPLDLYWMIEANYLNGRPLNLHEGEHEGEEEPPGEDPLPVDDNMLIARSFLNIPSGDNSMDLNLSYSLAVQEGEDLKMHSLGASYKYRIPDSFKSLSLKNEYIIYDNTLLHIKSSGGYSQAKFSWNAYWDFGGRFDWAEFSDSGSSHSTGGSAFLTYNFTETTYLRGQYRIRYEPGNNKYDEFFLQIVWGIGPHSHRLAN
ncbi:MAG: hypothetical protein ACE5GM_10635 [bacterium]